MIDFVWNALISIFDYFFAQNAPMTILILVAGIASFHILRTRELRILKPLEAEKNAAGLLKEQMQLVEDNLDDFHATLYGLYRKERKKYVGRDSLEMDSDTFMHSLQLWGVQGKIRNEIRRFFRDNHLADKTDSEFHVYKDMRKEHVWSQVVKGINEYWFGGMVEPSRSDMYDIHQENKDKILSIIDKIFDQGRDKAIEYRRALQKNQRRFGPFDIITGGKL
jgi:hypothetical protein